MNLHSIAKALKGDVASGAVSCPGPGHSKLDRSLRVYLDHQSPTGIRVHSHAGDDWQSCQEHVLRLLGLPTWESQKKRGDGIPSPILGVENATAKISNVDRNSALALSIWQESRSIAGTIAEPYINLRIGAR